MSQNLKHLALCNFNSIRIYSTFRGSLSFHLILGKKLLILLVQQNFFFYSWGVQISTLYRLANKFEFIPTVLIIPFTIRFWSGPFIIHFKLNTVFFFNIVIIYVVWFSFSPTKVFDNSTFNPLPGRTFMTSPFSAYPDMIRLWTWQACDKVHFLFINHRGKGKLKMQNNSGKIIKKKKKRPFGVVNLQNTHRRKNFS